MDINDILVAPTGVTRPDHPDFWKLSEIILALKADREQQERGEIDMAEFERRWRKHYETVGDFDSIAYSAIQCAFALHGIETGGDWNLLTANPAKHMAYVQSVQAFFDGFIMGALLERKNREER
jgi:hypothetical protein